MKRRPKHKLVIIGSGVAGIMSATASRPLRPKVFESSPAKTRPLTDHHAVMRIRDPATATLLGCGVEEISVHKMVYIDGKLTESPSIRANNLYSLKLYGELGLRSIKTLGTVKRFALSTLPTPSKEITSYNHTLIKVRPGVLEFRRNSCACEVEYESCISTIPMPVLMKAAGIKQEIEFKASSVNVLQGTIKFPSSVHQTVYYPDWTVGTIYRISISGRHVMVEAMDKEDAHLQETMACFGLDLSDVEWGEWKTQKTGKMSSIDQTYRKHIIYRFTDEFRIYSVGRYAVWKPKRIDHLVEDLAMVNRMITARDCQYQINKERGR